MGEVGEVRARTEAEKKVCDLIKTGTLEERQGRRKEGKAMERKRTVRSESI